jgi:antitoxin component of MazEF toxin-antitoxin module
MKNDDVRLLRLKAQDLGIKYVTKYNKAQLKAMIAKKDPEAMMAAIFGEQTEYTQVVRIPKGITKLNLKIEVV